MRSNSHALLMFLVTLMPEVTPLLLDYERAGIYLLCYLVRQYLSVHEQSSPGVRGLYTTDIVTPVSI